MELSLKLTQAQERQLADIAARLHVSPSDLAAAAIRDLLSHPDDAFTGAAERVLAKNLELYKRLA
jgi:hypothetical protein